MTASWPERLAYLQRAGEDLRPVDDLHALAPEAGNRAAFLVEGISRESGNSSRADGGREDQKRPPPTAAFLAALNTYAMPVAFAAGWHQSRLRLHFGTWTTAADKLGPRREVLQGLLGSLASGVELTQAAPDALPTMTGASGYLLGIPTPVRPEPHDPTAGLDRLIRTATSSSWTLTVLAWPVREDMILDQRLAALNESHAVTVALEAKEVPKPLADAHLKLTAALVDSMTSGLAVGVWRTSVYLVAEDRRSPAFPLVASALRGLLNGEKSLPEPVRVIHDDAIAGYAARWAVVDVGGRPAAGRFPRMFEYQTLLTSDQLAAYIHLPEQETAGFRIREQARFDRVPRTLNPARALPLGHVLAGASSDSHAGDEQNGSERQPQTATRPEPQPDYFIDIDDLTKHVFVPGVTGAGKTNTIFHLLVAVHQHHVPFLVLEPAKTEYRALTNQRLVPETVVYTVGREAVAPIRLNPFEVIASEPGSYDVAGHIDRLRSLFVACFGLWNPLPAILERSLYRIYTDRGWDLRTGKNTRWADGADPRAQFPTMTDLALVVEDVINQLGYNREIADNMRGALSVRVDALRLGAKGRMLDTRQSTPPQDLFEHPTVVELEGLGDEDDKAFLMGLLLIQLAAYRRSLGGFKHLTHLLVVEEAHRLLRNVSSKGAAEENNSAYKAVESFGNLLAEVRAYGQGIVIADQVPTGLAPIVIKNTNLKIAHRLVSLDDRQAVGAAMAMNDARIRHLAVLQTGETAVYTEGEDNALLVQILPPVTKRDIDVPDPIVRQHARLPQPDCPGNPTADGKCCAPADTLLATTAFRRAYSKAATAALFTGDLSAPLADLADLVTATVAPGVSHEDLARCIAARAAAWFADRRGAQYGWDYDHVRDLTTLLAGLLSGAGLFSVPGESDRTAFRSIALPLHARATDPFPGCPRVCPDGTCIFRGAALDLTHDQVLQDRWRTRLHTDGGPTANGAWLAADDAAMTIVGDDAGDSVREFHRAAGIRAALCYAQHAARADDLLSLATERLLVAQVESTHGLDAFVPDEESQ